MQHSEPSEHGPPASEPQEYKKLLCSLPAEIVELIIEYTLDFPGRPVFDGSLRRTTTELVSHPILRTSKQLRHYALTILRERCLWIRFTCDTIKAWQAITEMIPDTPSLTDVHRPILECPRLQTFDIICGDQDVKPESEALWKSTQIFFMFPFSSQGWFEFVDLLHDIFATPHNGSSALTIRCESNGVVVQESLNTFILPSLLRYRPLQKLERFTVEGSSLSHLSEEDKERPCRPIGPESSTEWLQGLLDQSEDFWRKNRKIDAAFAILHSTNLYVRIHRWLRRVLNRRRPGVHDGNSQTEVSARWNEQYCLINKVQLKVALCLHHLYSVKSKSWLQENIHLVEYASQWVHDVDFSWIGLRYRELAQLEFASALTFLIEGALVDDDDDPRQVDTADVAKRFHTKHRRMASSLSAYVVSKLWPEMPERRLLEYLGCDPISKYVPDPNEFFVQVHNAGGTGFMWSGNPRTMNQLGHEIAFRHLWRYRPRLSDRADDVERNCDLDCKCILY